MPDYKKIVEMNKLMKMLVKAGIPFEIRPVDVLGEPTLQICSPSVQDCVVDAVCNACAYGGKEGLIEVLGSANPNLPNDDVVGWCTANEAFQYFAEM